MVVILDRDVHRYAHVGRYVQQEHLRADRGHGIQVASVQSVWESPWVDKVDLGHARDKPSQQGV
jgi:hypothetical protein